MTPDTKEAAIEAGAKIIFARLYLNETWDDAPGAVRQGCISTARAAIDAYEKAMPPRAVWTYDAQVNAHYFAIPGRSQPPYKTQIHVEAIIDVAHDGTLAGVEIVDPRTPRPPEGQ